jgi:hypothetical protein
VSPEPNPGICQRIPCAGEQGINSRELGIYFAFGYGAGNSAQNRSARPDASNFVTRLDNKIINEGDS